MSFLKIAGAVGAIAAGAIVLYSQISKVANEPEAAPRSFEETAIGFLAAVGVFADYVAHLAEQGIEALTPPAPAAASAAPEQNP